MTKPIRVTIDTSCKPALATMRCAIIGTAIQQLSIDGALKNVTASAHTGNKKVLVYPARGAKPFVLRVLHEFAALCEE